MKIFYDLDEFKQAELTNNRSAEELQFMYDVLRESVRRLFSRHLMEHDVDHPYDKVIVLYDHEAYGLSSLALPFVDSMYMDQAEGLIFLKFDYDTEYTNIDEVPVEKLLLIAQQL